MSISSSGGTSTGPSVPVERGDLIRWTDLIDSADSAEQLDPYLPVCIIDSLLNYAFWYADAGTRTEGSNARDGVRGHGAVMKRQRLEAIRARWTADAMKAGVDFGTIDRRYDEGQAVATWIQTDLAPRLRCPAARRDAELSVPVLEARGSYSPARDAINRHNVPILLEAADKVWSVTHKLSTVADQIVIWMRREKKGPAQRRCGNGSRRGRKRRINREEVLKLTDSLLSSGDCQLKNVPLLLLRQHDITISLSTLMKFRRERRQVDEVDQLNSST